MLQWNGFQKHCDNGISQAHAVRRHLYETLGLDKSVEKERGFVESGEGGS